MNSFLMSDGQVTGLVILIVIVVVALIILSSCVKIVSQTNKYIIERLGVYNRTLEPGFKFVAPFIDRVVEKVNLKEQVKDFQPQPVITKDNVTMQIDTVVFFQITDPKSYVYGVDNPLGAIENLSATTLRNIIGDLDLDESLTSRDIINTKMRTILDEATDPWGIKVNRVEVKNIIPPKDIREAMEKQMRAERERREVILRAEGQKKSQILKAEGEKESAILRADGEREQMIRIAEGERQRLIRVAEGKAEAVRVQKKAEADGLKLIKEAGADKVVLQLKSLDTFSQVAQGQATKIIIPSEIQNLSSLLVGLKESATDDKKEEDE